MIPVLPDRQIFCYLRFHSAFMRVEKMRVTAITANQLTAAQTCTQCCRHIGLQQRPAKSGHSGERT